LVQAFPLDLIHRPVIIVLQIRSNASTPQLARDGQPRGQVDTGNSDDIDITAL
jgi:hypothetical protein